jgi:nitrite reductase/ring-hydroxylating ferredoxin subunit
VTSVRPRPETRPEPAYSAVNPAYPKSWWIAAFSCDVKGPRTVPLRVLERDLVLWRDSSGTVHCQAGHCPHLGAHFGYGGEVAGDRLRCGFHGWRFDPDGRLAEVPGPDKPRESVCLPTFRIVEWHGALFLWNGAGEPDIEFPDFLGFLSEIGATEDDVTFHHHRWFLPFPAKWFGENLADGMHFAIAHDTGGWGDTIVHSESPTVIETENAIHDRRKWISVDNVKRRFARREMINLLTPVVDNVRSTCWGGSVHLTRFAGRPRILGTIINSWTPVDADSHYVMDITLVPRSRVPVVGRGVEKAIGFVAGLGNWSTAIQDAGLMMHRREPVNPPYGRRDQGLIAFRRFWDSRVESHTQLLGDDRRSNGLRAGIRVRGREPAVPSNGVTESVTEGVAGRSGAS